MPEYQRIELDINTPRTEIDEIIGNAPGWLLHSGITFVALFIAIILGMAAIIRYPDKIISRGLLTSKHPPIEIKNKTQGLIEMMYAKNGDQVIKGDPLLYINNTSKSLDITRLETFLLEYESIKNPYEIRKLIVPNDMELGEIQNEYAQLVLKINEYSEILGQSGKIEQQKNIDKEILNLESVNISLQSEIDLLNKSVDLIEKDHDRAVQMEKDGLISRKEKEGNEVNLLEYMQRQEAKSRSISDNKIRINALRSNQLNIKEDNTQRLQYYQFGISEIISRIRSRLRYWRDQYYIIAPISGTLNLNTNIVQHKYIQPQESIGYIINSQNENERLIKVYGPTTGLGKVNVGDKTIIKFDGYPYKEYGTITCHIRHISSLPMPGPNGQMYYEIELETPNEIVTNYGKIIPFKPNSNLTAEIITEDKTILGRIFNQIISLVKES